MAVINNYKGLVDEGNFVGRVRLAKRNPPITINSYGGLRLKNLSTRVFRTNATLRILHKSCEILKSIF